MKVIKVLVDLTRIKEKRLRRVIKAQRKLNLLKIVKVMKVMKASVMTLAMKVTNQMIKPTMHSFLQIQKSKYSSKKRIQRMALSISITSPSEQFL